MNKVIVVHNGHLNVDLNPDVGLHGESGAPGEREWIIDFQHNILGPLLTSRGYTVKFTDGSGPKQDFVGDVFIADHYDGGSPSKGYFNVAHYQPDNAAADADRLCALLADHLAKVLPYPNDPTTVTINETRYYGFTYESQADAIIEHGNGSNTQNYAQLHDPALTQAQAVAMADALDAYFGNTPAPAPASKPTFDDVVTWLSVIGDDTYLPELQAAMDADPRVAGAVISIRMRIQQFKAALGA